MIVKFFKHEKRHLSKHTKAKPTVRRSVVRSRIFKEDYFCVHGTREEGKRLAKMRADKVRRLGPDLIKAMEWGYMRKSLDRETRHLPKGERLGKQKEIAKFWMDGQRRREEASR